MVRPGMVNEQLLPASPSLPVARVGAIDSCESLSLDLSFTITIIITMKTKHYVVRGIVQGVFFRHHTREEATRLSIRGTVKNLPGGEVEVYAQGAPENLQKFEEFLHRGPATAHVTEVVSGETDTEQKFEKFEVIF
jgi:acylphosphatase